MEKERDTNSLSCDVPRQVCTQASTDEFDVSDRDEDTTIELSRPMPAPDPVKRQQFEEKLASTPLGSTSDGLLTLLRDHPELVSNRLAQEAERILPDESVRAPRLNASSVSNYAQSVYEGGNVTSTLFPNKTAHSSPNVAPTIPMTRADSQYSLPDMARNTLNSMGDPTIHTSVLRQSSTKKRVSRSMSISRNLGEPVSYTHLTLPTKA